MTKHLVKVLLATHLLILPALGIAQERYYIGGHLGMAIQDVQELKLKTYWNGVNHYSFPTGTEETFAIGAKMGYNLAPDYNLPLRFEIDYTARDRAEKKRHDANVTRSSRVALHTFMFNAWFDISTGTAFTPYVGGGIGIGFIDFRVKQTSNNGYLEYKSDGISNIAWGVGAGFAYKISPNWTVDLGYRYIDVLKISDTDKERYRSGLYYRPKIKTKSKVDVQTQDILLTVRYTF